MISVTLLFVVLSTFFILFSRKFWDDHEKPVMFIGAVLCNAIAIVTLLA